MTIDITKTYQTRDGRKARVYATDGYGMFPVHAAVKDACGWLNGSWPRDGKTSSGRDNPSDLVPVKTWRAWKHGEAPRVFMMRHKSKKEKANSVVMWTKPDTDYDILFEQFVHVHEDCTETPCGVLEE